jgi:hypothetical protein
MEPEMIEPPEVPHTGHHKTHINWFDVAMAVGVLTVSLGSLFVALHTGHTMERLVEQNERLVHAQSTPILQFSTGNAIDGRPVLEGELTNVGSGAARVVWIRFAHDGRQFVDWGWLIQRLNGDTPRTPVTTSVIEHTILSAGETRTVFQWPRSDDPGERRAWEALNQARWKVTPKACFCSLFDECWTSELGGDLPVRVESCEAPRPLVRAGSGH